ncbi:type VII secretion protein EssB [Shouchella lonarensis]|uniref:Type VII secretion protein EssB n=1 Tax=Shouchella lonarensis TaxID=1464122 RepID=A0A1G6HNH6_9BACI|nr:type VII secretion protein EssB [Shouchella lonarensis]SDB95790.1 type VII secretion protein EssB [Shouchella lonarensis]
MSERKKFYLEEQTGAQLRYDREEDTYTVAFQKAEVKLTDVLEAGILDSCDAFVERELQPHEDELQVIVKPKVPLDRYKIFKEKDAYARLLIANNVIHKVAQHEHDRLHLMVSPENILVDKGLGVTFIHYGVRDSLPIYEKDINKLFVELRTTLLVLVDGAHHFNEYLNYRDTLKLSKRAEALIKEETIEGLQELIQAWIKQHEEEEKTLHKVSHKRWRVQKWALIGVSALLVPLIFFAVYILQVENPKQQAFQESSMAYFNNDYSTVVDVLESFHADDMPRSVKYQLAQSYIAIENLAEDRLENIRESITPKVGDIYYDYWIAIGRGNNKEAVEIARGLQQQEWVVYANSKYRREVERDKSLSHAEREALLKEIDDSIKSYSEELKKMYESYPASTEEKDGQAQDKQVQDEPAVEDAEKNEEEEKNKEKEEKDKEDGGDAE